MFGCGIAAPEVQSLVLVEGFGGTEEPFLLKETVR